MKDLQRDLDLSMIFITHELSVLVEVSTVLAIMYAARSSRAGRRRGLLRPAAPVHAGARGRVPRDRRSALRRSRRGWRRTARPQRFRPGARSTPVPGGVRRMPDARARAVPGRPRPQGRVPAGGPARVQAGTEPRERHRDDDSRWRTIGRRQRDPGPGPARVVRRSRRAHAGCPERRGSRRGPWTGSRSSFVAASPCARGPVGVRQDQHRARDHGPAGGRRGHVVFEGNLIRRKLQAYRRRVQMVFEDRPAA